MKADILPAFSLLCLCHPEQSFSAAALLTFRAGYFFAVSAALHCRKFKSIPDLYSSDAKSTSPVITNAMSPNAAQCPLGGKMSPA